MIWFTLGVVFSLYVNINVEDGSVNFQVLLSVVLLQMILIGSVVRSLKFDIWDKLNRRFTFLVFVKKFLVILFILNLPRFLLFP